MNEGGAKGKTVCAILQNDVYGQAGLEGVEFAGTKLGFELKAKPSYKAGDQDFTAQVNELKNANCQVVFAVALADRVRQDPGHGGRPRLRTAVDGPVAGMGRCAAGHAAEGLPHEERD